MAILAELWAARNEALTAKMAVLAPGPARGTLLAYFPESRWRWLPANWSPRRLLLPRGGCLNLGQVRRNGVSLCRLPQLRVR